MNDIHRPTPGDSAVAALYWGTREFKVWAVDVRAGPPRRRTYARTWYARSRTAEGAVACVKRNAWDLPRVGSYVARLAGPAELGCQLKGTT